MFSNKINKIAIIGIGYVGLPLTIELAKYFKVIAYDKNEKKINDLNNNIDRTNEINKKKIKTKKINFTSSIKYLKECKVFIVTVPTPITFSNNPDLTFIKNASKLIGKNMKTGSLIIFESTVYPGCTEDVCLPIIEKYSNLKVNKDFYIGYSPERVNPGDNSHSITKIAKIISSSSKIGLDLMEKIYSKIIKAKIHKTSNIKTAEAAKVIENIQRDLNIGLMNELSQIFAKLDIDTHEVIQAASTKWNFIKFYPGLVGGHCIGVDPYYLTYKAKKNKFNPKVILSARNTNNEMPIVISKKIIDTLKEKKIYHTKIKILIMGLTFKENCRDVRNSKVFDLFNNLNKKFKSIDLFDPNVDKNDLKNNLKQRFIIKPKLNTYNLIIISVKHKIFKKMTLEKIQKLSKKNGIIIDLLNLFPKYRELWKL